MADLKRNTEFIDATVAHADLVIAAGAATSNHVRLDRYNLRLIETPSTLQGARLVLQHSPDALAPSPVWTNMCTKDGELLALQFTAGDAVMLDHGWIVGNYVRLVTVTDGTTPQTQSAARTLIAYAMPLV